jgi:hypothetical protein
LSRSEGMRRHHHGIIGAVGSAGVRIDAAVSDRPLWAQSIEKGEGFVRR